MSNFYDDWLGAWDRAVDERRRARKAIHERELEWVETPNDFRAALLIARETGFRTWGSVSMLTEIPPGSHTGSHQHGEEVIYVLAGEGFTIVGDRRYDWAEGSGLAIPFSAPHQHFNTGTTTARLFSGMAVHLEQFVGLHKLVQHSEKGRTTTLPSVPRSPDGKDETGRRIALAKSEARPVVKDEDAGPDTAKARADLPSFDPAHPLVIGDFDSWFKFSQTTQLHRVWGSRSLRYMRIGKPDNDFQVHEMEISNIVSDPPHMYSGRHAHMEALLYVVAGEGYIVIDGERIEWTKGSALHIQGPQTDHRHFVTSDEPSQMIRLGPGLRYFIEPAAKVEWPYLFLQSRQGIVEGEKEAEPKAT